MAAGQFQRARELNHGVRRGGDNGPERFHYEEEFVFEKPFDWQQAKRMAAFVLPYRRTVMMAVAMMLLATLTRLAVPGMIALAIDLVLSEEPKAGRLTAWLLQYETFTRLNLLVGLMVLVHLINWAANHRRIQLTNHVGQRALFDLRQKLFGHIQTLSFRFFDTRPAGSILVRVMNDVNSLQDLFTNGVIALMQDILTLIGIILIMLSMHAPLALICFAFLPFVLLVTGRLRSRIRHGWQLVRIKQSRVTAHVAEAIQGVRVTQSFRQEEENKDFFTTINADNRHHWLKVLSLNAWFNPIVEVMAAVGTAVIYWYGTTILKEGLITVGVLVAFVVYLGQFWEPIQRLTQLYGQILVAMASSERIGEYLDINPTVAESETARELPPIAGKVEFEEVVFAYEEGRTALNGVSLTVEPGERVALVGHTGAGKSSIINLLSRFYDVTGGSVRVDGHDLRTVTLQSLRAQIGLVLQDTFIFSGTVMENIRFGRLDASDEEVIAAAKVVRADDFISNLPKGYQTEVKERGSRLSMGERQLISFARALLANPRILILDEATASIDTQTELRIQEALDALLQGRTSFVIAHRLSTIHGADQIVVLEQGKIAELGNHQSLMQQRGLYYDLIQAQFRFFVV